MIIRNQEPLRLSSLTQVKARRRSSPTIKFSTVAIYASVFVLIISIISIGYDRPETESTLANASIVSDVSSSKAPSVDSVIAADVAASVAQVANLSIANNVSDLAVTVRTKSETLQPEGTDIIKPQIIESINESRFVTSYIVKENDSIDSIAINFNISTQTIKWANNLTNNYISVGDSLKILPFDGVLYSVKTGDTINSIAKKYGSDEKLTILDNDLEVSGLIPNNNIVLRDGSLPAIERPGYVAPIVINYYSGVSAGYSGRTWYMSSGTANTYYAYGNCTRYAYNRRNQLGLAVGTSWGNAASWATKAANSGILVNRTPSVGAIMQNGGYLGHVAIVESIAENGDLTISEMNASYSGGGYNIVSGRIVNAQHVSQYLYIH